MQNNTMTKFLIDQLTDGQLQWAPLEKQYDTVAIGDLSNPKTFPIMAGREEFRNALYEKFPEEKKAIDKYLELLKVRRLNFQGFLARVRRRTSVFDNKSWLSLYCFFFLVYRTK